MPVAADLRHVLVQYLEGLHRAGVEQLGAPPAVALAAPRGVPPPPANETSPAVVPVAAGSAEAEQEMPRQTALPPTLLGAANTNQREPFLAAPLATAAERVTALDLIRREVAACTRCPELACTRTQTVFGVGEVRPRVMFFGEAPGADEDRTGEPFVGRAGQLLTDIIKACTWRREDVYIFNVLKCRPPGNRTPGDEEVANCRSYFERQIEIIRPEYIVCVGAVPTQALLETKEPIGKMRGRFHDYRGLKVLCTYHPSYLLRNPSAKRLVWDDMKFLLADMGVVLPPR